MLNFLGKNFYINVYSAFLLLFLISDFTLISENNLTKISILLSLFFINNFNNFLKITFLIAPLILISSIGIILSNDSSLTSFIYPLLLLASISQGIAITNILLSNNKESIFFNIDTEKVIIYFYIFLILIGFYQGLFVTRPRLIFFESNYLGYWLPLLVLLQRIGSKKRNNALIYGFVYMALIATTKSLTVFGILFIMYLIDFGAIILDTLKRLIVKYSISKKRIKSLILIFLISIFAFFYLLEFTKTYTYLFMRLEKIFYDPSSIFYLAGCRTPQFNTAREVFSGLPLLNKFFGGRFEDVRLNNVLCEGKINTFPLTGIFSLFSQYGYIGMTYVGFILFKYFFKFKGLLLRIYGDLLYIPITNYLISIIILMTLFLTNLTYAAPFVFIIILYYKLSQYKFN